MMKYAATSAGELGRDFHMQECCNGKEAFTLILKKAPDLIISDIMMPEMDGMTLCSKSETEH